MKKINIKAASEKIKVIDPDTGREINKDGEQVVLSKYWRRRLSCGDIIEIKEEIKKATIKKVQKKNSNKNTDSEE